MRTGFVWHERYMWQEAGTEFRGQGLPVEPYLQPGESVLGPEPKRRIKNLLETAGVMEQLTPLAPRPATVEEICRVHSVDYVERIRRECASGGGVAGSATILTPSSFDIALLSAGGAMAAVDAVIGEQVENAYALVRPPGHHAKRDEGMGLCIFANLAVAARHLQSRHGVERVAIVDWDVHHGNGSQSIFYEDPTVLTISLHQANVPMDDESFGTLDERGAGAGEGYNLNVPLPPGSGRGAYMAAIDDAVVPALERFQPQFILLACGLDASLQDPGGQMLLLPGAYRDMTQALLDAAGSLCDGRLVAAHEGGYSSFMTPFCGLSVIATLRGVRPEAEDLFGALSFGSVPDQELQPHQADAVEAAARQADGG